MSRSTVSRRLREFVGVALFAAALIWMISLVTYEPTDPVWFFSTGSHAAPANFAGRVGAFLAELSFQLFGYASYVIPALLVIIGWHAFWCREVDAAGTKATGAALYEDGEPSAFTKTALEFCSNYQQQHALTAGFCSLLHEKDMLVPQQSDIELANGRKIQLRDFQIIDMEKFQALPDAELLEWNKRGYLALVYYIVQSTSNWRYLLERANAHEPKN